MATTLGTLNPLRYRGYVYDQETGLYYLQSRYYNPEMGRFINADALISTGQGLLGNNMFAYCNNNPVMHIDVDGEFPWIVLGIIVGCGVIGGIWGYNSNKKLGLSTSDKSNHTNSDTNSTNALDMLPQNQKDDLHLEEQEDLLQPEEIELTTGDRIKNTVIGTSLGVLVGGGAVIAAGVVGAAAVGSATVYISGLGATGAQTVAIGALAYDFVGAVITPFLGLELELIEWEP